MKAKVSVIQAAAVARGAGNLPDFAAAMVDRIRKPVIDWRAVLRRYIDESVRKDYTWSRPNRRHIAAGLYLPGTVPDGMACLGVIVDVSGSTGSEEARAAFLGELQGACGDAAPDLVVVLQCNTQITRRDEYRAGDQISPEITIGGGTDMRPAFEDLRDIASVIICFTDLDFSSQRIPADPGIPVLWAKWGGGGIEPAFGETIQL